jgi:hypothetical protein
MHDLRNLEARNVISVGVATTEFEQAAKIQNAALGYDPAVIYVPHPIQDRTNDELRALAEQAFDAIMTTLTAPKT